MFDFAYDFVNFSYCGFVTIFILSSLKLFVNYQYFSSILVFNKTILLAKLF